MLTLSFTFYLFCHLINFLPDVVVFVVVVVLWSDLHTPKWGAILRWTPLHLLVVVAIVAAVLLCSSARPLVLVLLSYLLSGAVCANQSTAQCLLYCYSALGK